MMDQDINGFYYNDYGKQSRGRAISQLEFLSSKIGGQEKLAIHPIIADPLKSKYRQKVYNPTGYRINEKEIFEASINFDNLTRKNPARMINYNSLERGKKQHVCSHGEKHNKKANKRYASVDELKDESPKSNDYKQIELPILIKEDNW